MLLILFNKNSGIDILERIQQQFNRIEKHQAKQLDFSAAIQILERDTQLELKFNFVTEVNTSVIHVFGFSEIK